MIKGYWVQADDESPFNRNYELKWAFLAIARSRACSKKGKMSRGLTPGVFAASAGIARSSGAGGGWSMI